MADEGAGQQRVTRRRWIILGVVLVVVAAVVGVVTYIGLQGRTAEDAVRQYVQLIADGKAAEATAMVDPKGDRRFLTDQVLGAATDRIAVTDVFGGSAARSGDTAAVTVDYTVNSTPLRVTLRAERLPGVVQDWKVIDPMVAPAVVQTLVPTLTSAYIGPVQVPASGDPAHGAVQHPVLLYPGRYPVSGARSKYLRADPRPLQVVSVDNPPKQPAQVQTDYRPTAALTTLVSGQMRGYVAKCYQAGQAMPASCPLGLYEVASFATDLRPAIPPTLSGLAVYQLQYNADGSTKPAVRFTSTEGLYRYTGDDGEQRQREFYVYGAVDISATDTATITFTDQL